MIVTKEGWTLHYTIGSVVTGPVSVGDEVDDYTGDLFTILEGGLPPHNPTSAGRVLTLGPDGITRMMYPEALGLKWVKASNPTSN